MTGIQALLIVVVIALALLLFVVGFQVLLVIVDLRRAIKRLNSILGDAILGGGLIRPDKLTGVMEFFRKKRDVENHGQG